MNYKDINVSGNPSRIWYRMRGQNMNLYEIHTRKIEEINKINPRERRLLYAKTLKAKRTMK